MDPDSFRRTVAHPLIIGCALAAVVFRAGPARVDGHRAHAADGLERLEQIRLQHQRDVSCAKSANAMVSCQQDGQPATSTLNIDDCWHIGARQEWQHRARPEAVQGGDEGAGRLRAQRKGLKFGIYAEAGARTCAGRPGSNGYEEEDANQFAAWGVDYLKYDWCNSDGVDAKIAYPTMRDALKSSRGGQSSSACASGAATSRGRGPVALRTSGGPPATSLYRWSSFVRLLDQQVGLEKYAGPGGWNEPGHARSGRRRDDRHRSTGRISASGACSPRR